MKTFVYGAYGSNLHPMRLKKRCPSAKLRGTCDLPGWRLVFRKGSKDDSVKCDAEKTGKASDKLWIAVFDIRKCEESNLDSAEGLGHGYRKETVNLTVAGKNLGVKIYLADEDAIVDDVPYEWYKKMVLLGAEYHSFPNSYLRSIQDVESKRDNRPEAKEEWDTVKRMQANRKRQR